MQGSSRIMIHYQIFILLNVDKIKTYKELFDKYNDNFFSDKYCKIENEFEKIYL